MLLGGVFGKGIGDMSNFLPETTVSLSSITRMSGKKQSRRETHTAPCAKYWLVVGSR